MQFETHTAWVAAHRVLHTTELLELILLRTTIYDMYTLQRVSKTFQHTIYGSPKIRRAMFLDMDTSSAELVQPIANPILEYAFDKSLFRLPGAGFLDVQYYTVLRTGGHAGRWLTTNFDLYPALRDKGGQPIGSLLPKRTDTYESWRDMLLMQPPPVEIEASIYKRPSRTERGGSSVTWFDGAMSLGEMFEWLEKEASRYCSTQ